MDKYYSRRNNRLKDCDYSLDAYYYVTICIEDRNEWLGDIINNEMILNSYGNICRQCWLGLPNHYSNLNTDVYIIMPNHIHGILIIDNINKMANKREGYKPSPTENTEKIYPLSEIIRGFKTFSSKQINQTIQSGNKFKWQRSFYDHIIRNDQALNKIRGYIINNPFAWAEDQENIKNTNKKGGLQTLPYCRDRFVTCPL